jgi:flagellar motor switch protein FliM
MPVNNVLSQSQIDDLLSSLSGSVTNGEQFVIDLLSVERDKMLKEKRLLDSKIELLNAAIEKLRS